MRLPSWVQWADTPAAKDAAGMLELLEPELEVWQGTQHGRALEERYTRALEVLEAENRKVGR